MNQRDTPALFKSLTLWDVVAMNIVAIVGLRWISRSARIGAPAVTLWILAGLLFFVPLAAVLAELSSRHPQQGGIYAWARRAFGPTHGFICGWCMWVNNLFYFPALLLFAAANALIPLGIAGIAMALVFIPPAGTENVLNYEANLIGQAAILIGIGMALYFTSRRQEV